MAQYNVIHSPSIGLYRLWASLLNREDMKTICQPPRQQRIVVGPAQEQCFCQRPSDCPVTDQSQTRAVIRSTSNIFTPFSILRTILALANKNSFCNSSVQTNWVFGLNKCQKCFISSHFEKAHETCSIMPKNALACVMYLGAGKFLLDSRGSCKSALDQSLYTGIYRTRTEIR